MKSGVEYLIHKLLKFLVEKCYKYHCCNKHNWIALPDQRWYKSVYNNRYDQNYYKILKALEYTSDKQGTVYWCECISYTPYGISIQQDTMFCCDLMGPKYEPVSQEEYEMARQKYLDKIKKS